MSKPLDPKSIVNPFLPPSLADVLNGIVSIQLSNTRKRDLCSGLRRCSIILGEPLNRLPAALPALEDQFARTNAAAHNLLATTFSKIKCNTLAAVKLAGFGPISSRRRNAYTPAWRALLAGLDKRGRYGLTRLGTFGSANAIEPHDFDDAAFSKFATALSLALPIKKARTVERDTATLWNRVAGRQGLNAVTVPDYRKAPTRLDWAALPASFVRNVESHLAWAGGSDPFAENVRPKPLSPHSLRLRRQQILTAVSALAQSDLPPTEIRDLSCLTTAAAFKIILRRRFEGAGKAPNTFNHGLASALIALAKEWTKVDGATLIELKRLRARLPVRAPGLVEKNKKLFRDFSDPDALAKFLSLPDTLFASALKRSSSFRSLAEAQAGIAIAIALHTGLRVANFSRLRFGHNIFLPTNLRQETRISLPAEEMKNRHDHSTVLGPRVTKMLANYRTQILDVHVPGRSAWLFDAGYGKPKRTETISYLVKRIVWRHVGVHMTIHQFRHLGAKLQLDAGGEYETVRQFLGQRNLKTTVNSYSGIETERAARKQAALLEERLLEADHKIRVRSPRRRPPPDRKR